MRDCDDEPYIPPAPVENPSWMRQKDLVWIETRTTDDLLPWIITRPFVMALLMCCVITYLCWIAAPYTGH